MLPILQQPVADKGWRSDCGIFNTKELPMALKKICGILTLVVGCFLALAAGGQEIVVVGEKAGGVYGVGEKIAWRVEVKGEGAPAVTRVGYVLKKGGLTVMKEGVLDVSSGAAVLEATLDAPGTILAELKASAGGKEIKGLGGAAVAPEKIGPSAGRPADFDAFWKAKIEQLHAIPMNAKVEASESGKGSVDYFKIEMDNINGSHIYGQLARPKREGKFPALLIVQWAGVYGLPKGNVVNRADGGWLALNIMPHDLPFDQPEDFYKKAAQTTLKDYVSIGQDDREKSYFLRMYLSCYRALDYLAERPDWDGKTLVVMGTSQGGQQSLVIAGLHPKLTAMSAMVPAGCDVTGPTIGRAAGFPYWADHAKWTKNEKILETGRYFDAVNFAPNVKCPSLVALGLIDQTCPSAGVFAACNRFGGPKEVIVMVNSDHQGRNKSQAEYYAKSEAWLKQLAKGEQGLLK
jgi:cephalosporin-C deacetylase